MAKRDFLKIPRWGWWLVGLLALILAVSYLIIKPYFGWQERTVDNFVSISYPKDWQTAPYNSTELYGLEHIYLISNYNGKLSFGDTSSASEVYRIEVSRIPKDRVKNLMEEHIDPYLQCQSEDCSTKISRFQINSRNVIEAHIYYNKTNSFYREFYLIYIETDKFYYVFGLGYVPGPGSFSDFLRTNFLKKIVDSITIK